MCTLMFTHSVNSCSHACLHLCLQKLFKQMFTHMFTHMYSCIQKNVYICIYTHGSRYFRFISMFINFFSVCYGYLKCQGLLRFSKFSRLSRLAGFTRFFISYFVSLVRKVLVDIKYIRYGRRE
jgi:hypothetical protein